MKLRHTFRIYPSPPQQRELARVFGSVRLVFNWALALRRDHFREHGKGLSYAQTSAALTVLKATPERAFLREVSCVPLQQCLRHLQSGFTAFFEKRARHPRFKSKRGRQSAEYTRSAFRWDAANHRLLVAGLGPLPVRWSRKLTQAPSTVTITKDEAGRYFVSLCVDEPVQPLPPTGTEVGIDLGVADLATLSTGEKIANPRHLAGKLRKLARLQRVLAQRRKGSGRWQRQRLKVARLHARIADTRKDHMEKATTDLVRRFDVLAVEDLHVRGMLRNRRLARSLGDASMGAFRRTLVAKAARYGRTVLVARRFEPTSKCCSECGHSVPQLPLAVRTWTCSVCERTHDRDHNAAKNILAGGHPVSARGGRVRRPAAPSAGRNARRNVNRPALS